ncbi:MAG: hypothetical protein IPQ07_09175 [Myxococcales bacterium]|nr:hypothetical protein [Myxococcales bacterium]
MTTSTRSILVLLVLTVASVVAGCGDDGIHHLPDAPPLDDAAPDTGIATEPLLVTLAGTGTGTITSLPAGISCGASCEASFPKDTVITLTATPGTGSVFAGWSGACTGTQNTCEVTLGAAKAATATFNLATYTVTVTKAGAGSGTVSGGGISCGVNCSVTVPYGTQLTLTSAATALSTFAGWGGACSGTTPCTLTITDTTNVSANFSLDNLTLFVTLGGNGTGSVTSSPAGISCGVDCSETYTANQMITLTASAGIGSTFTGWSGGGCNGTGTCTVTMTAAITVTATFTLNLVTLTITKSGTGAGIVSATGISCGADCTETVNYGTSFTLAAAPSTADPTLSKFTGWTGGGCSGTGGCTLTLTADHRHLRLQAHAEHHVRDLHAVHRRSRRPRGRGLAVQGSRGGGEPARHLRGVSLEHLGQHADSCALARGHRERLGARRWARRDELSQMHGGTMVNAPQLTEAGADVGATQFPYAWTGTSTAGTYAGACSGFAAFIPWAGPTSSANVGQADLTTSAAVNAFTSTCDVQRRLYCLGIDRAATAP